MHEAVRLFDTLAPLINHPDFIKESEWRLVSDPVDLTKRPIRLREGRTGIVPYIEQSSPKTRAIRDLQYTRADAAANSVRLSGRMSKTEKVRED